MRGRILFVYGFGLAVVAMLALSYTIDVRLIKNASIASTVFMPERKINQEIADRVVNDIIYIMDPRSQKCFAYKKGSGSISYIPHTSTIPLDLLYTGHAKGEK